MFFVNLVSSIYLVFVVNLVSSIYLVFVVNLVSSVNLCVQMSTLTLLQHRQLGTAMNPYFAYQSPSMASQTHLSKYICGSRHFVERLKLIQRLKEKGHHGCVNSINFSHSGQLLASGSDDLKIVLWDWQRGVARTTMETDHVANIFQVCPPFVLPWEPY